MYNTLTNGLKSFFSSIEHMNLALEEKIPIVKSFHQNEVSFLNSSLFGKYRSLNEKEQKREMIKAAIIVGAVGALLIAGISLTVCGPHLLGAMAFIPLPSGHAVIFSPLYASAIAAALTYLFSITLWWKDEEKAKFGGESYLPKERKKELKSENLWLVEEKERFESRAPLNTESNENDYTTQFTFFRTQYTPGALVRAGVWPAGLGNLWTDRFEKAQLNGETEHDTSRHDTSSGRGLHDDL